MRIINKRLNVHQLSAEEWTTLCEAENILLQIQNSYPAGTVIANPCTGEVVEINELARARGILGFLTDNMVVEVVT